MKHMTEDPSLPSLTPASNPWTSFLTEDALQALLASSTLRPNQPMYLDGHPLLYGKPNFPGTEDISETRSPFSGIGWGVSCDGELQAEQSTEAILQAQMCQATLDYLNADISDDELGMWSGNDSSLDLDSDKGEYFNNLLSFKVPDLSKTRQYQRSGPTQTCTLRRYRSSHSKTVASLAR